MCDIMCNLKCRKMEQVEKRVLVLDTKENKKYTLPNYYDASIIIGCTAENVRKRLKKGSETLICERYKAFPYSEEKYNELTKEGVTDGHLYDAFKVYYDKLFGSLYRGTIGRYE